MVKQRGMAVLAVLGNIVTAWSWFGTNFLGVGLHSYGFMAGAMWWLLCFDAVDADNRGYRPVAAARMGQASVASQKP